MFDQHRHASSQTAAADWHKYAVEMGVLREQFQRQRALPGNHHRMVERRHPGEPHKYAVEMGVLREQFQRQRALPGNHHRMVERRHPGEPLLL